MELKKLKELNLYWSKRLHREIRFWWIKKCCDHISCEWWYFHVFDLPIKYRKILETQRTMEEMIELFQLSKGKEKMEIKNIKDWQNENIVVKLCPQCKEQKDFYAQTNVFCIDCLSDLGLDTPHICDCPGCEENGF